MLYYVVLVYAIHQHESAIGMHLCPLSWTSLPPTTPSHPSWLWQDTELGSLYYTTNPHCLSLLHLVIYMFQCYSLNLSHPLLPLLCPQVCSLCLYCCPANMFTSTIFLDFIFMHEYRIFVFLFLTHFTLYKRL